MLSGLEAAHLPTRSLFRTHYCNSTIFINIETKTVSSIDEVYVPSTWSCSTLLTLNTPHLSDMGNNISVDSYLNYSACGGRNITHAYLLSNGAFPTPSSPLENTPFANCTNIAHVLHSHCCEGGICRPSSIDHEFVRYEWNDWNGLGYPYVQGDGKVLIGAKGKDGKKCQPPLLKRGLSSLELVRTVGFDIVGMESGVGSVRKMVGGSLNAGRLDGGRMVGEGDAAVVTFCGMVIGGLVLVLVGIVLWRVKKRKSRCLEVMCVEEREVEKGGDAKQTGA